MSTALGIANSKEGVGTTDVAMRQVLGAQWETAGVVTGLTVSGTTTLGYRVSPGVAVCSRGSSDGKSLAWWEGGMTPAISANPSPYPRLDTVYVYASDLTQGDTDNLVHVGVAQGTPAPTPTAPAAPTYAVVLASMRLPGGSTTTLNASVVAPAPQAIPYGASLGILVDKADTSYMGVYRGTPYTFASDTFTLPSRRLVTVRLTTSLWAWHPQTIDWLGSGYVEWVLDGVVMRDFRMLLSPGSPVCASFTDTAPVEAGTHTITARLWGSGTEPISDIWLDYAAEAWPGQRLQVVDEGPAR